MVIVNNSENIDTCTFRIDTDQIIEEVLMDDRLYYEDEEKKNFMGSLIKFISKSFDLIRSILIRVVFGTHLFVAICLVCFVRNELWYLVNMVGIVFIVIEWFAVAMRNGFNFNFYLNNQFIIKIRLNIAGKDLQWFSPSFFLYIATIIPPTWFLELENIRLKIIALETLEGKSVTGNASNAASTQSNFGDFFRREPTSFGKSNETSFYDFYDEALPILLPSDIKVKLFRIYFLNKI